MLFACFLSTQSYLLLGFWGQLKVNLGPVELNLSYYTVYGVITSVKYVYMNAVFQCPLL